MLFSKNMSGKLYHRIKKNGKWTWVACDLHQCAMCEKYFNTKRDEEWLKQYADGFSVMKYLIRKWNGGKQVSINNCMNQNQQSMVTYQKICIGSVKKNELQSLRLLLNMWSLGLRQFMWLPGGRRMRCEYCGYFPEHCICSRSTESWCPRCRAGPGRCSCPHWNIVSPKQVKRPWIVIQWRMGFHLWRMSLQTEQRLGRWLCAYCKSKPDMALFT